LLTYSRASRFAMLILFLRRQFGQAWSAADDGRGDLYFGRFIYIAAHAHA